MYIRTAHTNDLPEILRLFENTIRTVCTSDYTPVQIEAWAASAKDLEKWNSKLAAQYFWVAEIDQQLAGFGSLAGENYLDFLYVHKDFQRRGVARALLHAVEEKFRESSAPYLESDVSITARPFFEGMGFSVVRENRNQVRGVEIINFKMRKPR